jgi:hypothetical protein
MVCPHESMGDQSVSISGYWMMMMMMMLMMMLKSRGAFVAVVQ